METVVTWGSNKLFLPNVKISNCLTVVIILVPRLLLLKRLKIWDFVNMATMPCSLDVAIMRYGVHTLREEEETGSHGS